MKNTVRVSFDVSAKDHSFLKSECAKARMPLKNLMKEVFQKTVEEYRKKQLDERLKEGIQEAKEGKGRVLDVSRFKEFADE